MSNKTGGKRSATINSDISNHTMVSEVPPERPNIRVSPAVPRPPSQTVRQEMLSVQRMSGSSGKPLLAQYIQTPVGRQGGTGTPGQSGREESSDKYLNGRGGSTRGVPYLTLLVSETE